MSNVLTQRLIVIVCFGGFGLFVVWGAWFLGWREGWENYQLAQESVNWVEVTVIATKTDVELVSTGSGDNRDNSYLPKVSYSFLVDGQVYRNDEIRLGGMAQNSRAEAEAVLAGYPLGQEMSAFYNPANPAQSVLEPGVHSNLRVSLLFSALFMLLGALILVGGVLVGALGPDRYFQAGQPATTEPVFEVRYEDQP